MYHDYSYAIDCENTVFVYFTINGRKTIVWLPMRHLATNQIPAFFQECWPVVPGENTAFPKDVATEICQSFSVARDELIDRGVMQQ